MLFGVMVMMHKLGDKLCVTLIATGFKSSPITGFEKAPEKVVSVLEEDVKKEIVAPLSNPMEQAKAVESIKEVEPFLKDATEIVEEISAPIPQANLEDIVLKTELTLDEPELKEQASIEFGWDIETSESVAEKVNEKPEIIVHTLDDEAESAIDLEAAQTRVSPSPEEQQRLTQERLERIQQYTNNRLKKVDGINELEKEPAFVRRNIQLSQTKFSEESSVSRFNVSSDDHGNVSLKSNNSFLHDNVD
jgi:cell division protein FtsZ